MDYGRGSWPNWALDEITKAKISKFLEKTAEKQNSIQSYNWLLSLIPSSDQPVKEELSEWESDDSDAEKFPDCLSFEAQTAKDKSSAQQNGSKFTQEFEVPSKENAKLIHAEKEQESISALSRKFLGETEEQQELVLKSSLQVFNEENCSKDKKLQELSVLKSVDDSTLITFIQKANVSIKNDEKKAEFCLLISEVLKDRIHFLGKYFYLPWSSGEKDRIPATSLSQIINLFYIQACEDVLLPLLNSSDSGLVKDPEILKDILILCDPECWSLLLRNFIALLSKDKLAESHLPALKFLCQQIEELEVSSQTESIINELSNLLRANSVDFNTNRYFGEIILLLINAVKRHQTILNFEVITSQLSSIIQFLNGAMKLKAKLSLKKLISGKLG